MTIKQRLMDDLKQAMKARDKTRVSCLRMLRARVLEQEVAARAKQGREYELDDDEALAVLSTYAKQRRDSIESYREGGREDLATQEESELAIVRDYLPEQLSEDKLRDVVRQAIDETGAGSPKQMGLVMQLVMSRVRGSAEGQAVSRLVREMLEKP